MKIGTFEDILATWVPKLRGNTPELWRFGFKVKRIALNSETPDVTTRKLLDLGDSLIH
jgi:hypothetical protein